MISDSTERVKGDKKAVTKGEGNRGETIKSGLFVFGVDWKVSQPLFLLLSLCFPLQAACLPGWASSPPRHTKPVSRLS